MPLTRDNVTVASRIMLPTHVLLSGLLGAGWAFQDQHRTNVASLQALRQVWPIAYTGWLLLLLALVEVVAMLSHRRALAGVALGTGALAYLGLAVASVVSLHPQLQPSWPPLTAGAPDASLTAPLWPLYPVMAHIASMVSLSRDEFTDAAGNHYERTA